VHNEQFPHARDPLPNSDHTTILAPDACPRISREWCGRQQSKKESLRRCRQMDAKHADGPETGMVIHGGHRTTKPGGAAAMRQPRSHLRVLRTSACICENSFLLPVPCSAPCPQVAYGGITASAKSRGFWPEPATWRSTRWPA
jgi:hypothetical protein